jgi:WD40 repeat protein
MRSPFAVFLLAMLPAPVAVAGDKPAAVQPIKVVTLERKEPVSFEKDVEPILLNKCSFCHGGNVKEGKLDLGTYEGLMKGGKRGSPVAPGKSADSLLCKVSGKTQKPFMPPKSEEPLSSEELALIKLWVDQGAKPPAGQREKAKPVVQAPPPGVHPVRGLAVSPDNSAVAASRGNRIDVYDAGSGTHVRTLTDPDVLAPDGKPLGTAHLALVESLAWSPDGKYLASGSYQVVTLWDARTGGVRRRLGGVADRVVALGFSPDGKLLATGGGAPTEAGEVKVFDVATGEPVTDVKNGHSDTVFGVAFSPDGKTLATCGADKFVKTWEVPSGKPLKSFEGHTHHVLDVGWKADGKLLASAGADNVVKVWDFEKGEQVRTIAAHARQVTRLLFVGKKPEFVTCGGDQQVRVWNADNGGNTRTFGDGGDYLSALGVSPDGSVVAAGGDTGVVRVYNGANGQLLKTLLPPGIAGPAAAKK